jgi:uncharacterized protein (TIGR02687 family)
MDLTQLKQALARVFEEENARVVFWNDPEQEFAESLSDLELDGVQLVCLDTVGALEVKILLERKDPDGRYLLYSPAEEPDFDSDWLLDIRLYSRSFRADRASIILDELGLAHQSMRAHITRRRKFFDNKERLQKLKNLVASTDDEQTLDRKMLAVITRAEQPELFNILRTLYHALAQADEPDLDEPPSVWAQIEKFELDETFWALARATFGYTDENPTLRNLLIRLFVADFAQHLGTELPSALTALQLPASGAANAVVCLAQWRDSASKGESYNYLADAVAERIHLDTCLGGIEVEGLLDVMTFFDVEKAVVRGLLERVAATAETIDGDSIRNVASRRQAGHWVASTSVPEDKRKARHSVYEALAVAAELLMLRNQHTNGFESESAVALYRAYEESLYRFDQLYRLFCEHADVAEARGWDVLKTLRAEIESVYCNWYLTRLGLAWGKWVDHGLLQDWRLDGVDNQYRFYQKQIKPRLDEAENRRVFVIISDALRYEVAEELSRELNGKYRFEAELHSQLGVLPSYTALGMASLLPHQVLTYKANGDVLADGKQTSSLQQRHEILQTVSGLAIKAEELVALNKEAGREQVADYRVVYVYHNEIDARGDSASTESGTFDAARKAIGDLGDLVGYIVNNLNGTYVVVTADHGFLFTETSPDETDKSKLMDKPAGTVKAKKRYILGHKLGEHDAAWHGHTAATSTAEGDMEFWIPKAANRFHFTGGARFVHGGAMLQEVVVPVIRVKHARTGGRLERTRTRQVTVQVLGTTHKITAQKHRFRLVQMEPVSDRVRPARLKVAVYDGDEPITSIESVTFDTTSGSLDERQKDVILTLQDRAYDKRASYRLVLRDPETGIEQQSVVVTIDRVIADDFDF